MRSEHFHFREAVIFQNPEEFARSKSLRRGSESDFAWGGINKRVRGKRLDQPGLFVAACTKQSALHELHRTAAHDYINRAILARIFRRWRTGLNGISHVGEPPFAFLLGQRCDLFEI